MLSAGIIFRVGLFLQIMLNVQLVHWQPGDHFRRDTFCDQVPMTEVCNSCLHPAPPPGELSKSREIDSTRLNQELESLALELQAGSEQVRNIWDIWHDSCQDYCESLLDKPQTAPPPASPTMDPVNFKGVSGTSSTEGITPLDIIPELDISVLKFDDNSTMSIHDKEEKIES